MGPFGREAGSLGPPKDVAVSRTGLLREERGNEETGRHRQPAGRDSF